MRGQKGITLVALIITIIVLLILAVVAIAAVKDDGLVGHAQNAQSTYQQAQENEATTINGYESYMNNIISSQTPAANEQA